MGYDPDSLNRLVLSIEALIKDFHEKMPNMPRTAECPLWGLYMEVATYLGNVADDMERAANPRKRRR